jgi:ABC-type transport system substrate-binding protein
LWDSIFIQVASDLKAVGFQMSIRMSPTDVIQGHIQSGTWRGSAWGAPMFSAAFDALEPLRQHSCLWHAPWFCDEAMMPAIQEAMAAPDVDSRRAATERVMASSHDRAQALFVYESVGFIGVGPRVKNFRSDFGFLRYEMMEVE